jgi:hypothetical protein
LEAEIAAGCSVLKRIQNAILPKDNWVTYITCKRKTIQAFIRKRDEQSVGPLQLKQLEKNPFRKANSVSDNQDNSPLYEP